MYLLSTGANVNHTVVYIPMGVLSITAK